MGTAVVGTFSGINWGKNSKFIQVEMDPTGGTNYTDMGTTQMMSVPYALFCANGTPGPQGPAGVNGTNGVSITNSNVINDSLYITLSNGQILNSGYVKGAAGAAGTNAGVGGFTHYLGETFDGGIIYYLYKGSDGLEHGLIVALTESTAAWQSNGTTTNAILSWDGAYNTALMTNSPAATYIAGLGAGWYLPSIDELYKLYDNRFETNKALFNGNNTLISNAAYYWSSTESSATYAYKFTFLNGYASNLNKTLGGTVRGVRAF